MIFIFRVYFTFLVVIIQAVPIIEYSDLINLVFVNEIPTWLPQCKNNLTIIQNRSTYYTQINIGMFTQMILSEDYPNTTVYGYGCQAINPVTGEDLGFIQSIPGPTLLAYSQQYLTINFTNTITGDHLLNVDWTLLMDPYVDLNVSAIQGVPTTVHVHGQIVESNSDGYPGSFTTSYGTKGPFYYSLIPTQNNSFVYQYPNLLQEATLFYHDHSIGLTRLNNYVGMSGIFLIESRKTTPLNQIDTAHDIILVIQDKTFNTDGSLWYESNWVSQFYGTVMLVNGKVWPKMKVQNGLYRLRFLNACNSRFLNLTFQFKNNTIIPFTVVKADSSYLDQSYETNWLMLYVAERYQILINFTSSIGDSIYLKSNIISEFSDYTPIESLTTEFIMRFDISYQSTQTFTISLPITKTDRLILENPIQIIQTVIIEQVNTYGAPIGSYFDGHSFSVLYHTFQLDKIYELHIINLMHDPHPLHIHLGKFQVVQRLSINKTAYFKDFINLNGALPYYHGNQKYLDLQNYFLNITSQPQSYELADRDIVQANPSEVLIVRIRFSMQNGSHYPINVTGGPGYIFQCHILEHQDNSLMSIFRLQDKISLSTSPQNYIPLIIGLTVGLSFILLVIFVVYYCKYWKKNKMVDESGESNNLETSQKVKRNKRYLTSTKRRRAIKIKQEGQASASIKQNIQLKITNTKEQDQTAEMISIQQNI